MASMMVTYIGEAISKNRFSLSYGMVFTLFFRKLGLSIPADESVRKLKHTDFCNKETLDRMGYSKKETIWVRTHPPKQSTSTTDTNLPSSAKPATLISNPSETLIPILNTPQQSDSLFTLILRDRHFLFPTFIIPIILVNSRWDEREISNEIVISVKSRIQNCN